MLEHPQGNVTFLFSDVEASTRLLVRDPVAAGQALDRHHALLRASIEAHRGEVFETVGDAVYAAFARPSDAVAAALDGQRALAAEPWSGAQPVRVRMGLHTGEVEERAHGHYFGVPLFRAARLMAIGHGGQVLLSSVTAALVSSNLPERAGLQNLGQHRLKDFSEPEPVFQLVHPDLRANFPLLKGHDQRLHHVPTPATALVGREHQVAAITDRLLDKDVRLLTLTGPGGVGKTRLSLAVAAEAQAAFTDGVYFVPLAAVRDWVLVVPAIAQALGIQEVGERSLLDSLWTFLQPRTALLVLDNFEQVVGAAAELAQLIGACPQLKLLVTSRTVLRLYGEREYVVPPLTLPDSADWTRVAGAPESEAVRLFADRARAVRPDFTVGNGQALAVAEICRRLDGLPLAIELAAARVRLLPPDLMLARLDRRMPLLTGGARDLPERHATLHNAIAWSYDLLDEHDKSLFRRLSVFENGWTLDAAEAVCTADGDFGSVLDGLDSLAAQSLIRSDVSDRAPRFRMLETIREFASEQLQASGECTSYRRIHAAWYTHQVLLAESSLRGPDQHETLRRLEDEHDNIRAAIRFSIESQAVDLGLSLGGVMGRFWLVRGYLSEGSLWLERLLSLPTDTAGPSVLAKVFNAAGNLAAGFGNYDQATVYHQQALALRRELGDQRATAQSLHNLAALSLQHHDHLAARRLFQESLELRREVGDSAGIARTLQGLSVVAREASDFEQIASLSEQALAAAQQVGDAELIALAQISQAYLAQVGGDEVRALELLRKSLEIFTSLGDMREVAECLELVAGCYVRQGRDTAACHLLGAAELLLERSGLRAAPTERFGFDTTIGLVRAGLSEADFRAAWQEGRAMQREQWLTLALEHSGA
jgi:predicted ATPase/class 3 adenylate cyclase